MRLKARLKRLAADVQWLKYDGALNVIEKQLRLMELLRGLDEAKQRRAQAAAQRSAAPARVVAPRVEAQAPLPKSTPRPTPPPTPPPEPPAPMPGQPTSPRSADSEIRPVTWRPRTAADHGDEVDVPGTNGRCITDYDVLGDYGDDDDDD